MNKEFYALKQEYSQKRASMSSEQYAQTVEAEKARFDSTRGQQNYADVSARQMAAVAKIGREVEQRKAQESFGDMSVLRAMLLD